MHDELVRLQLTEFSEDKKAEEVQVLLDFSSGALTRHAEQGEEFTPRVLPFAPPSTGITMPSLPNTTIKAWWHSPSLDRTFAVYSTADSFDAQLAICGADGACSSHHLPPEFGGIDTGAAQVWDEEHLVQLRLQCCVCSTHLYVSFNATTITPLYSRDEAYSLGAAAWDDAQDAVFVATAASTRSSDEPQALVVRRYAWASDGTQATTDVVLAPADVEAFFVCYRGGCMGAVAGGIAAGTAVLLCAAAAGCMLVNRRRSRREAPQQAAFVEADKVTTGPPLEQAAAFDTLENERAP